MSADATVHCQSCCRLRQRNVSNCCVARPWDSIPKVLNGSPGLGCNWFQVPTQIFVFYNPVDFFLDLSYFSRDGGDGFPHLLFFKKDHSTGRGQFTLQITGVLGASCEDPEICYERLIAAAAPGSALHLWCRGRKMLVDLAALSVVSRG